MSRERGRSAMASTLQLRRSERPAFECGESRLDGVRGRGNELGVHDGARVPAHDGPGEPLQPPEELNAAQPSCEPAELVTPRAVGDHPVASGAIHGLHSRAVARAGEHAAGRRGGHVRRPRNPGRRRGGVPPPGRDHTTS